MKISIAPQDESHLENGIIRLYKKIGGDMKALSAVQQDERLPYLFDWALARRRGKEHRKCDSMLRLINRLWSIRGIKPDGIKLHKSQSASRINPESFIRIAANSVGQLRKSDVDRVLTEAGIHAVEVATYLVRHRPDLKQEVVEVMNDELDLPFKA